ncbi:MAG: LytTR family DNA-binding domain-containing protein [Edaphobacter sp.]
MKLRTLIADDEPLARDRLKALLAAEDEIELAGECRNGREVVEHLKTQAVDLLFLDIQMPGNTGFDVIDQIGSARMPLTVFVTAHHHYAVKAFEVHALDYLTKPIEPLRLRATLARVRERVHSKAAVLTQEAFQAVMTSLGRTAASDIDYPRRLLVPNGTKDSFVDVGEIEWIEASDYYACLHVGARSFMLRETMKELAQTLDPKRFVRIHRSAIVNVEKVREIVRDGRSDGVVVMSGGQRLKMSKVGWQALLAANRRGTS